ncbi:MAG: alpha/beta hydrolase [Hyphomicrobiaceae bacterium]|nr:alpha/beta hydrolase [Hyphomicrobiaceae bacterium]
MVPVAGLGAMLVAVAGVMVAMLDPAFVLNLLAPRSGIRAEASVAYGPGERHRLDVYAPAKAQEAPVVVFFYGGSWQRGAKETFRFVAASLARRGLIAVIPDYTLYPQGRFPRFLEDGAAAVAWTKANAARYGGDARRIFIMGHSAGAHIAAMLALDGRWLARSGLDPRQHVAGLVGLAGPYDFLPIEDPIVQVIFESDAPELTQPITFVSGGEPPVYLGVAPQDTTVRPGNSERLAARLKASGARVELARYPRTGHVSLIGAMSPLLTFLAPVADDVAGFVHSAGTSPR